MAMLHLIGLYMYQREETKWALGAVRLLAGEPLFCLWRVVRGARKYSSRTLALALCGAAELFCRDGFSHTNTLLFLRVSHNSKRALLRIIPRLRRTAV